MLPILYVRNIRTVLMSELSVDLLSIDNYSGLQILQGADFF
jgi:hypothetical protein